ncbi:SDR family oxidoreductase [Mangrovicella endophytica]|uniref:SDR family oxidoreductase n=1 Tax=Mangrovicella endophytica TaxID=2066697 RepID=UPI000C9DEC88|nr:SDR family oxidoreductase [Mangrovicella endophytica]
MQTSGNTILITGGGSGIGRGLAEAFHARGNTVIIAGRRADVLAEVTDANPGMASAVLDIADVGSIPAFAEQLSRDFPALDAVIHSAGIMKNENLKTGAPEAITATADATVATNLLGPIHLTTALLPHLLSRPRATVMTVTSGLAFLPLAMTPTYCATKAAIHSWSQSLRYQLKGTGVSVLELAPPYVRTALMGERQAKDPAAMALDEYIAEVMTILETQPDATEILVEAVKPLRYAERNGGYEEFFQRRNDAMLAARAAEF